jgi:hypothetical protein
MWRRSAYGRDRQARGMCGVASAIFGNVAIMANGRGASAAVTTRNGEDGGISGDGSGIMRRGSNGDWRNQWQSMTHQWRRIGA